MGHVFVTNDYPPKLGGIQSYLYELWRRLPPAEVTVITTAHQDAAQFDATVPHRIIRLPQKLLLPTHHLASTIRDVAARENASLIVLDPVLPLGILGPSIGIPYALVLHGAEVTVPGRLPATKALVRRTIAGARLIVAAGTYPAFEARRLLGDSMPETVIVPPGVDGSRFRPLDAEERGVARRHFGVGEDALVLLSVSRLVPRKGMDVLIEAAARLSPTRPHLTVLIGGVGRDEKRLRRLVTKNQAPVRLLGAIDSGQLEHLYGMADLFVMLARNRWLGLEQEGFGIVYLEAAASGVAQVAGRSGGTADAVENNVTGVLVDRGADVVTATAAIARLLDDTEERQRFAKASRDRALSEFDYDELASKLKRALEGAAG